MPDVITINHGTIWALRPMTDAAKAWINDNVDPDAQWYGRALIVEPRYAPAILGGLEDAGLTWGWA